MVVNHANSILFVANSSAIYAYSISSNGALTALNSGSAVATAVISAMDVSPDGNMLYALDENSLLLRGFTINNSTGALSESTDGNLTSLPSTISAVSSQAVKVAPNGGSVFVALGSAGDMFFPVTNDTLGTGTPFGYISKLNSDNAITVDPTSAYIYIARSGNNGGLAVYSASNLSLNTNPYPAGNGPYSVVTNFAGSDVYVANRTDGNISGFSVTSSSTSVSLTSLSTSPYSSGSGVNGLAADKSGDYLLAINSGGSPGLSMYSYDSTTSGALDPAASATTGSGTITIAATH
jgi:6-phosphogluconolactonase (cycloisomerase 2 family)